MMNEENRPVKIPRKFKDHLTRLHPYSQMRLLSPYRDLDFPFHDRAKSPRMTVMPGGERESTVKSPIGSPMSTAKRRTVFFGLELEKTQQERSADDSESDEGVERKLTDFQIQRKLQRAQSKIMQKFDTTNEYGLPKNSFGRRKAKSIFSKTKYDPENNDDTKQICKSVMQSPSQSLERIGSKDVIVAYNKMIHTEAHKRKNIHMPDLFDGSAKRTKSTMKREVSMKKMLSSLMSNPSRTVVNRERNHPSTEVYLQERLQQLYKPIAAGSGKDCTITKMDVLDLEANLNQASLNLFAKKYPQLSSRSRSQLGHHKSFSGKTHNPQGQSDRLITLPDGGLPESQSPQLRPGERSYRNQTIEPGINYDLLQQTSYDNRQEPIGHNSSAIHSQSRHETSPDEERAHGGNHQLHYDYSTQFIDNQHLNLDAVSNSDFQSNMLPPLQVGGRRGIGNSNFEPMVKKKPAKNRFIFSKETIKEFKLKDSEIPPNMKEVLDADTKYTDHVNQNIRVAQRFNDINKIVYLSKIKFSLEQQVSRRQRKTEIVENERQVMQQKRTKWDEFRSKRAVVVDQYLEQKRKSKALQSVIKHLYVHQCVLLSFSLIEKWKKYRAFQQTLGWIQLKFLLRFKMTLKYHRGITAKHTNLVRNSFYMQGAINSQNPELYRRAKMIIVSALNRDFFRDDFFKKLHRMYELVNFIGNQFRNRFIYKSNKLILINQHWDKTLEQVSSMAKKLKNKKMTELCNSIAKVNPEVRAYMLKSYLEHAQMLMSINFYRSRMRKKQGECDENEIKLQIFKLQQEMTKMIVVRNTTNPEDLLRPETKKLAFVSEQNLKDFDLYDASDDKRRRKNQIFISTFEELGWLDPFPVQNQVQKTSRYSFQAPKKEEATAKSMKSAIKKYVQKLTETIGQKQIQSLALPNKKIMFKIMRACVGCSKPEQLWIYIDPNEM